jgi:hypothetical protein
VTICCGGVGGVKGVKGVGGWVGVGWGGVRAVQKDRVVQSITV